MRHGTVTATSAPSGWWPEASSVPDLRISAGELKGRKLVAGSGRPTTGRVREAIFSALGHDLDRIGVERVLDLYCGSGAMGIEAVSRGAARAVLVDQEATSARANVDSLSLGPRVEVIGSDAGDYLAAAATNEFDLIFCDPPYTLAASEMNEIEPRLRSVLAPSGRIVIEGPSGGDPLLGLPLLFDRTYGQTRVTIHRGDA